MDPTAHDEQDLRAACARLVASKYELDDFLQQLRRPPTNPGLQLWLWWTGLRQPSIPDDRWLIAAVTPGCYLDLVLPFAVTWADQTTATYQELNPQLVLGATYNHYPPATAARLDSLNQAARSPDADNDIDAAIYCKVGPLPLYVALEGKNRVRAYQQANQPIAANLTQAFYPNPEDLRLHLAPSAHAVVLSLRRSYSVTTATGHLMADLSPELRVLPFPGVAVPLLNAYGVPWGRALPLTSAPAVFSVRRHTRQALTACLCLP